MSNQIVNLHPTLIFSDLDGTLIDHFNYTFAPAKDFLNDLKAKHIAVIPNTSKTFAEVIKHRSAMALDGPLIVENGAGVFIPINWLPHRPDDCIEENGFWKKSLAKSRTHWLTQIHALRAQFPKSFEGFSEMNAARLCEVTGLSADDASLALQRNYSEPLLWHDTAAQKQLFIEAAQAIGARPLLGGRFLHICGQSNKGAAMQWLADEVQRQYPDLAIRTIALGDGGNDIDMLEQANIAVRIASPAHDLPQLKRTQGVYSSNAYGPEGWVEALQHILTDETKG